MRRPGRRTDMLAILGLAMLLARSARSQDDQGLTEGFQQVHMVHVAPHLLVLTPAASTAELEFRNESDEPKQADVQIELGYTYWPNGDTALYLRHYQDGWPRDTVVLHPAANDHYAGQWISGVPTHLVLKAHETSRVTLQIHPPSDLPDGEYYALIVVMAGRKRGKGKMPDTKLKYQLPVKGKAPPPLRDSVRVFYRKGPQSMGLRFVHAEAAIDTAHDGWAADAAVPLHSLRVLARFQLTGTTHFEGYMSDAIETTSGIDTPVESVNGARITIHADGTFRFLSDAPSALPPGHYFYIKRLIPDDDEFPPDQRLSMEPVEIKIPFDVPEHSQGQTR